MKRPHFAFAGLVGLSLLCGYVGYALGGPQPTGPCNLDNTSTCAYKCTPLVGDPLYKSTASTDATQVPYCANNPDEPACDPNAINVACGYYKYQNTTCTGSGNFFEGTKPGCKK
jgi:hypothetical protein